MKLKLNFIETFFIVSIIVLNIVIAQITGRWSVLPIVASITGVVCVVLGAKGHILNYLFGLIMISCYVYLSWQSRFWGEVMLNLMFYVPMQFIGFYFWRKHSSKGDKNIVQARSLGYKESIIGAILIVVLICAYSQLLKYLDGSSPWIDSSTTILSIAAMILAVLRFREQWYMWVVVNAISIVLWLTSKDTPEVVYCMVAMWSLYLINAIYGLYKWRQLQS